MALSGRSDSLYDLSEYLVAIVGIVFIPYKGLSGRPLNPILTTAKRYRNDPKPLPLPLPKGAGWSDSGSKVEAKTSASTAGNADKHWGFGQKSGSGSKFANFFLKE